MIDAKRDPAVQMVDPRSGHVLRESEVYAASTGEPLGNGPVCATCGDLAAWGLHQVCRSGAFGRLLVYRRPGRVPAG